MELNFDNQQIDKAIRENSKRSPMILDLANTASWIPEEKLFYAREFKNKIELARTKTPLTSVLPSVIVVFKKDNLKEPKFRLSFLGILLSLLLVTLFLFIIIKKIVDPNFQGDLVFSLFLLLLFGSLLFIEFMLTKKVLNKLKNRII